ncbi:MAG: glycerol-3-phosphate cytidylyltransferase [Saprospirales bacterium]|nr:MAG: glycerol-3-phosphate cytidylyltransferase [Saprospirales bacterium]
MLKLKDRKKVITYGTFDLFHLGHLRILERAKLLGSHLTVGISTDEFNILKGKQCYYPFEHRKRIVRALGCVDEVIPEYDWNQKVSDIINNDIDLFVMGSDWKGKFDHLMDYCSVLYLERTKGVSTTMIKEDLSAINR